VFCPGPDPVQFVYIWRLQIPGVHLALFAGDTCMYATDCKEGCVLRKLQGCLTAMEAWWERWNIKINHDRDSGHVLLSQTWTRRCSSYIERRNIPFVNKVKYLGVIFVRKVAWRYRKDSIATKAIRIFNKIYFLLKSERLSTKSKLTLCKTLIRSKMT